MIGRARKLIVPKKKDLTARRAGNFEMDSGKNTDFAGSTARQLTSVLYLMKPGMLFADVA